MAKNKPDKLPGKPDEPPGKPNKKPKVGSVTIVGIT